MDTLTTVDTGLSVEEGATMMTMTSTSCYLCWSSACPAEEMVVVVSVDSVVDVVDVVADAEADVEADLEAVLETDVEVDAGEDVEVDAVVEDVFNM